MRKTRRVRRREFRRGRAERSAVGNYREREGRRLLRPDGLASAPRNGKIFMEDVVALKREISGVHTPFSTLKYFKEMADMSSNGTIFIEDLVIINRMILSSIKSN